MSNGQMGFSNPLLAIPGGFAAIPRFFQIWLAHIFGNSGCIRVGQLPSFRLLLIIRFLLRVSHRCLSPDGGLPEFVSVLPLLFALRFRRPGPAGHNGFAPQDFENQRMAQHAAQAVDDRVGGYYCHNSVFVQV